MNFVTSLHVAAAVFLLGPLVFAASATPRALRAGAEGLGTLRFLAKTTQIYGYLSLLVVILGLANVRDDIKFSQTWVWLSLVLSVAAIGTFVAARRAVPAGSGPRPRDRARRETAAAAHRRQQRARRRRASGRRLPDDLQARTGLAARSIGRGRQLVDRIKDAGPQGFR